MKPNVFSVGGEAESMHKNIRAEVKSAEDVEDGQTVEQARKVEGQIPRRTEGYIERVESGLDETGGE